MRPYLPFFFLLVILHFSFNKNNKLNNSSPPLSEECGTDYLLDQKLNTSPDFKKHHEKLEKRAKIYFKSQHNNTGHLKMDYTLPIIVHIIHQNGSENISDAIVEKAIDDLNDAFANINFYGQGVGVDTRIGFCLARRDPDGNAATGINRIVSPTDQYEYIAGHPTEKPDPLGLHKLYQYMVGEKYKRSGGAMPICLPLMATRKMAL